MERLKSMKDTLMATVQAQMGNLQDVCTEELGEAIDMIKDLSEAIYYCTITEAMDEKEKGNTYYYTENKYTDGSRMSRDYEKMYYTEQEMPWEMSDEFEGESPKHRKKYLEGRDKHYTKEQQMKELEKYIQYLTSDVVDMLKDATPEEKRLVQNKLTTLATKVNG